MDRAEGAISAQQPRYIGSAYVQTPEMMYGSVVKMYPIEKDHH